MKTKLEDIIENAKFLSDSEKKEFLSKKTLFQKVLPSRGLLRYLAKNTASLSEKLAILEQYATILAPLPSSAIASIFRRALEKCQERLSVLPELIEMGIEGQAIGLALKYGDVMEKVEGAKQLQVLGVEGHAIGLVLQSGDVNEKVEGAKQLQALGVEGLAIGLVLQTGDMMEKVEGAKQLQALGVEGSAIGLVLKSGDVMEKVEGAKQLQALGVEGSAIGLVLKSGDVMENLKKLKTHLDAGKKLSTRLIPNILKLTVP